MIRLALAFALLVVPLMAGCVSVTSGYAIGPADDGKTKSVAVGGECA